jgi:hypothetical protein
MLLQRDSAGMQGRNMVGSDFSPEAHVPSESGGRLEVMPPRHNIQCPSGHVIPTLGVPVKCATRLIWLRSNESNHT